MVFPGEGPRAVEVAMTAAATSASSHHSPQPNRAAALRVKPRSRLPQPPFRAWHSPRLLRCVGAGTEADVPAWPATPPTSTPPPAPQPDRRRPAAPSDDGFMRIRAKLMDHLRQATGRIELLPVAPGDAGIREPAGGEGDKSQGCDKPANAVPAVGAGEELPWNLRARRSATVGTASNAPHHRGHPSAAPTAPSRPRSGAPERREAGPRRRRPRFSVPLTKEEIDEDLYAFTGRRAPRRPKKRPRALQKQLTYARHPMVFPGVWLSEVTVETYQVAEPPPPPPPS